jgi:hypothetical protein
MQGAKKLATYDDLLALPEDVKAEVIHGVLVKPPAPLPRHSSVQRKLARYVGGPFDDDDGAGGPGGWWILLEVDVRLGLHDIVRPDLAGWRRERLPDPWDTRPIDVVPDWICEIVSPSNAGTDRVTKRQPITGSPIRRRGRSRRTGAIPRRGCGSTPARSTGRRARASRVRGRGARSRARLPAAAEGAVARGGGRRVSRASAGARRE